jgi:hypothetical protein
MEANPFAVTQRWPARSVSSATRPGRPTPRPRCSAGLGVLDEASKPGRRVRGWYADASMAQWRKAGRRNVPDQARGLA